MFTTKYKMQGEKSMNSLRILSGNSNPKLAGDVAAKFGIELVKAKIGRFSDGEIQIEEIGESIRGKDIFLFQSTCPPHVNDNVMELMLMIDACRRASAQRINVVIPYYGYARQDRKVTPRSPVSAKVFAKMIESAEADRVIAFNLHSDQIQGFFDIPVDHLYSLEVQLGALRGLYPQFFEEGYNTREELVIGAPDAGAVEMARRFAKRVNNAAIAIIDKRREKANASKVMNVIGDVKGKTVILQDDMIDTAGTAVQAAKAFLEEGAEKIYGFFTHAVLSGNAVSNIINSPFEAIYVTDTIPLSREAAGCEKIKVLSVKDTLYEAIRRIHNEESVSTMFG